MTQLTPAEQKVVEEFEREFTQDGELLITEDGSYDDITDWLTTILLAHRAEVKASYTKGRSDEAKTCTGCQGRCEVKVEEARHDWLREEIVKLERMKYKTSYCGYAFRSTTVDTISAVDCINGAEKMGRNKALQTIIDRYQSELDQLSAEDSVR